LKRVWRGPTPAGTHLSLDRQQPLKELYNAALSPKALFKTRILTGLIQSGIEYGENK